MGNLKVVIGGLAIVVLFVIGLGAAWVQNNSKSMYCWISRNAITK